MCFGLNMSSVVLRDKVAEKDLVMLNTLTRRTLVVAAMALSVATAFAQSAASQAKFTPAVFAAAQAAGKPVIVEVSAPWCPTCKAQAPIIQSLTAKPEFKNITVLKVDFDSQKDVLKTLNVSMQSTLIAFKGKTETSRSTGDTTATGIEKLFKSAI
jgi:thioredoxin 1